MDKVDKIYPQTNYTTQQFYTKEEYEKLEKENARLKNGLKHYKRCLYKITSIANECTNSKMWDFEGV